MGIGTAPGRIPPPQQPEETPARTADHRSAWIRVLIEAFRETSERSRKLASAAWRSIPSYLAFYLLILVTGFAAWEGRKPVTVIAPFQVPDKASLPFSGETVANVLQDRLGQIHDEIERQKNDRKLHATDMHSLGQPGLPIPPHHALFRRAEVPTRFAAEVKGLSYQALIGAARAVMGTETTISGDVILDKENGGNFILAARSSHGGSWQSNLNPRTKDGLTQASGDLAEKILESEDPAVAGVVFLNQGQVERALTALKIASERAPKDVAAKLALCEGTEANEFYQEAMTCYNDVLTVSPKSLEVKERLAQTRWLYGKNGNRERALEDFDNLANNSHYDRALLGWAKALDDTGDHDGALSVYQKFLDKESDPPNWAIAYVISNDILCALTKCPSDPPGRTIAHVGRATAFAKLGRHEDALAELQKALDTIPDDSLVRVHKSVELADAGDLDAGITELQSVVGEKKGADLVPFAAYQLGELFKKRGDWQKASEQFRAAIERRPDYGEAHNGLAQSLTSEGRIDEARREFGETAKLSSNRVDRKYFDVLASQWLGNSLQAMCNYAGAASAYSDAIRMKPDYRIAHIELGHVFEQEGQFTQAIQEYRIALGAKPNELDKDEWDEWTVVTHVHLGEALVSEGPQYVQDGLAELRTAVMRDPKRVASLVSLGKALFKVGNYLEATEKFNQAISINKDEVEAHYGLALTLHAQGRESEATNQCQAVNRLRPDDPTYDTCPRQPPGNRGSSSCPPR